MTVDLQRLLVFMVVLRTRFQLSSDGFHSALAYEKDIFEVGHREVILIFSQQVDLRIGDLKKNADVWTL